MTLDVVNDVIVPKRDGEELDEARLRAFVSGVVDGSVPAYQASALLMAIVLRGFSPAETVALARAMVDSGKVLDLSVLGRPVLDKHSSGGVGDKVTLVLAPLVASCGALFGKMSGRGLGHTGGTLDKLESIPGFRVQLSQGDFLRQLERIGVAVVSQSERVVPADRMLYALRDVTGTVDSEGLIAASIMAKKIASGTSVLVARSDGGHRRLHEDARPGALARAPLPPDRRRATDAQVSCLYTAMDAPLGNARGQPARSRGGVGGAGRRRPRRRARGRPRAGRRAAGASDLKLDEAEARERAARALADGRAAEWFERWVAVQGGRFKPGEFHRLAAAEVRAPRDGWVSAVDALAVGRAAQRAGAGRGRVDDEVDAAAGVVLEVKTGAAVAAGDMLGRVYSRGRDTRVAAAGLLSGAFAIADEAPVAPPLVLGRDEPA